MNRAISILICLLPFVLLLETRAAENAVQEGSPVQLFCYVAGGSPNVNAAGRPMAREGEAVVCAQGATCPDGVTPLAGTIINGSSSVRINGVPAAVSDSSVVSVPCLEEPLSIGGWPFISVAP